MFLHLQLDLDATFDVWNHHLIRPSCNNRVPSGRPSIMYEAPELYGAHDHLANVTEDEIQVCKSECIMREMCPCEDKDVFQLCVLVMGERNLELPSDAYQATDLYLLLRTTIRQQV